MKKNHHVKSPTRPPINQICFENCGNTATHIASDGSYLCRIHYELKEGYELYPEDEVVEMMSHWLEMRHYKIPEKFIGETAQDTFDKLQEHFKGIEINVILEAFETDKDTDGYVFESA